MATKPKSTSVSLCCGECSFCHADPEDKKQSACFVSPPEFSHWEQDAPVFIQHKSVSSTRHICAQFKPREHH